MRNKIAEIQDRFCVGITSVLRRCAAVALVMLCLPANVAEAGAWKEFQARCLDPYENLEPAVFDDLKRVGLRHSDVSISKYGGHFAVKTGVISSDPAPLGEGERLCAYQGQLTEQDGAQDWIAKQLSENLYELETRAEDGSFIVLSNLWIEPKLSVTVQYLRDQNRVVYQIVETDLES